MVQAVVKLTIPLPRIIFLLEIPQERLLEDTPDALSPAELLEIVSEYWEINDMTAFFVNARRLAGQARTANTGYNAG